MRQIGFDNEVYLKRQADGLMKRAASFGNKLYLEFGGKLMYDYHAARVLPGYDPNVKLRLLRSLGDQAEMPISVFPMMMTHLNLLIAFDHGAFMFVQSLSHVLTDSPRLCSSETNSKRAELPSNFTGLYLATLQIWIWLSHRKDMVPTRILRPPAPLL